MTQTNKQIERQNRQKVDFEYCHQATENDKDKLSFDDRTL